MEGVRILVHAVRQVTGNLAEALRISLVLYLLSQAATFGVTYFVLGDALAEWPTSQWAPADPYVEPEATPPVSAAGWLALVASQVLSLALVAWIAVRWHRFVLLEERPSGPIPPWSGALVWAYAVRSFKIALVTVAAAAGLTLALLMVFLLPLGVAAPLAVVGGLLVAMVLIVLPLRVGLGLPAAALGGRMSTAESWRRTAPAGGAILVLALLAALLGYALSLLAGLPTALRLPLSLVASWFVLMVSVAVLTTLYGHLVEGRRLG
jgi:hypothetical protein